MLSAGVYLLCSYNAALAQMPANTIECGYVDSVINNEFQTYISSTIHIKNKSTEEWKGRIVFEETDDIKVMGDKVLDINLSAGQSYFSPVRYFLGKNVTAGEYHLKAEVYDAATGQKINEAMLTLHVAAKTDVRLVPVKEAVTLPQKGDTLDVAVKVSNLGNRQQRLTIVWSLPPDIRSKAYSCEINLNAYSDSVLHLQLPVTKKMAKYNLFRINAKAIFVSSGELASLASVAVQKLGSKKIYTIGDGSNLRANSPNYVSFSTEGLGNSSTAYHLHSLWSGYAGPGKLKFEFDGYKWNRSQYGTQISNTYLDYQVKDVGVRVGSIFEGGEVNLNGIGAKIYTIDTLNNGTVLSNSVGAVNKNFNLAQLSNTTFNYGKSAWAESDWKNNAHEFSSQIAYDEEPFYNTKSVLWTNNYTRKISRAFTYGGKLAIGDTWLISDKSVSKMSVMANVFMRAVIGRGFSFSGDNYYSGPYYSGMRKGAQSFNERISKQLDKSNMLWLGLNYNAYQPKYMFLNDSINAIDYQSKIITGEFGWSGELKKVARFSIIPSVYHEQNNQYLIYNRKQLTEMNSLRMGTTWGFSFGNQLSSSLRVDAGYNRHLSGNEHYMFRSSVSMNYRFLNFSATRQLGPQYLSDLFLITDSTVSNKVSRTQFSFGGNKSFLNNAMNVSLNCFYDNESYTKNVMLNGQLGYQSYAARYWVNVMLMDNPNYHITKNFQVGITYMLGATNPLTVNNKSSLYVKVNQVSGKANTSSPATDYVVLINKEMLVTDNAGNIAYTKLPAGDYVIKCLPQSGWMAEDQTIHLAYKQTQKITISLVQTSKLSGHLSITKDPVKAYPVSDDSSARSIVAIDENGKQFYTKTDQSGDYSFYLPEGTYSISVADLPAEMEVQSAPGKETVTMNHEISGVDFKLHIKSRNIETKHFGG
ncbi:hypothetical protein A9P82_12840 [Arachidicoccus ginsenosidimutans]|uniref:carboxypeptidase-like regulatory domain-containing protein n=1 Tax=Arachidicoccus sp. BS20 TaxID=1850526 RepID=UPI0007F0F688|nr:carboxypeptidase-like regulatory domain-containing protein [Arachidicoccus sp. BS20]ANI90090.1 hypothetical protein A9P82_12840 [Arachidicoccus sp. BS20]